MKVRKYVQNSGPAHLALIVQAGPPTFLDDFNRPPGPNVSLCARK